MNFTGVQREFFRVAIVTSDGGTGNTSASAAIKSVLEKSGIAKKIIVEIKNIGSHIAPDPIGKMSLGKYNMLDFHNTCARNGWIGLINLETKLGKFAHRIYQYTLEKYFREKLDKWKPDLVVSVVPFVNGPLVKCGKKSHTPVLVVATDPDSELFGINWPREDESSAYRYCIPYNTLEIANKIDRAVNLSKVRGVGYPVRSEFLRDYSEEEKNNFRKELDIGEDQQVVGVMMGGLGAIVTKRYVSHIVKADKQGEF